LRKRYSGARDFAMSADDIVVSASRRLDCRGCRLQCARMSVSFLNWQLNIVASGSFVVTGDSLLHRHILDHEKETVQNIGPADSTGGIADKGHLLNLRKHPRFEIRSAR
jgi:hypothetical protein